MEQDHSMETPFQSWLTWPSSLVPFLCWKSRKGMRRRLGGRTDTEETARRERPHLAQRPQASGPSTFHGAGAPTRAGRCGLSLPPTPRRPRRGLPARAEGLATPERGGLREAAGRREAEAWAPGQRWCPASAPAWGKGAARSSRRARGRWAGRGRRASRGRPRVPRDVPAPRRAPCWGRGHFTRVTGWFGSVWQMPRPRPPCGPRGLGVAAAAWGSAVQLLAEVAGDQINQRLGCRVKTELLGPDCLSMKPSSWLTRWSKLPYHSRFGLQSLIF